MGDGVVQSQGDMDAELRSAICIFLIAERREGATIGELASCLELGGHPATHEVPRVSKAVSELIHEGEVMMAKERVRSVMDASQGASDD
jgi:hypothetical protein